MPPVITGAKLVIEVFLVGDQLVDAGQILIAQRPQAVSNVFCISRYSPKAPREQVENGPGQTSNVARICNLPYRRIAFGKASALLPRTDYSRRRGLQIRDTAD